MTDNIEARMSHMEVELSALKEKVSFFNVIYGKFDVTLGKIQEMIENRRYENNEEIKDVYDRIEDSEKKLLDEFKNVRAEIKEQNENHNRKLSIIDAKIADIDRWRWIILGGAVGVGWFLERIIDFIQSAS